MGYKFIFIENIPPNPLVIKDAGDYGRVSLTNSAQEVVRDLMEMGYLPIGRRLFYFDSMDNLDEMIRDSVTGEFKRFAPGPPRQETKRYLDEATRLINQALESNTDHWMTDKELTTLRDNFQRKEI